jgi:hypothetical protein
MRNTPSASRLVPHFAEQSQKAANLAVDAVISIMEGGKTVHAETSQLPVLSVAYGPETETNNWPPLHGTIIWDEDRLESQLRIANLLWWFFHGFDNVGLKEW